MVLDALLKYSRKYFQVVTGHSTFITSQSLLVPVNMLNEKICSLSNNQQITAV